MHRTAALLLSLVLAPFLVAQRVDLEATITGPASARPDQTFTVMGTVTNHGPDPAVDVVVSLDANGIICLSQRYIGTLAAGETRRFECSGSMPALGSQIYSAIATLWVQSTTPDFDLGNNFATHRVRAITPPDLFVFTNGFPTATPGLPVAVPIRYGNRAEFPATGVTLTITTTAGFGKLPDACTLEAGRAICSVTISDRLDVLVVELIPPDQSAAAYDIRLEIDAEEEEAAPADNVHVIHAQNPRTFFITSTADRGSGTLRAAIENANADCADSIPCLIAFRIPQTAQEWSTIAPTSPLPRIVVPHGIVVDGTTQARYFADTNAEGPEIEISGTALREGNGLEIETGCAAQVHVRGLTINGFPGIGLQLADGDNCLQIPPFGLVEQNFIGTDPTGTRAVPNQRGIWMAIRRGRIEDNIISGNERSGVFVDRGLPVIEHNRIGLTRELQPLGNGASGVYISARAGGSDVSENFIGFNHHFGIGIAAEAKNVSAQRNSLQANWQHAIDWGLDGAITTTPVPLPEITSVRYENGHTIIEGRGVTAGNWPPMFTIFANDAPDPSGYGEGQYFLGEVSLDSPSTDLHHFTLDWPGDLRGKWVTATATQVIFNGFLRSPGASTNADNGSVMSTTSEFSRAWEVK